MGGSAECEAGPGARHAGLCYAVEGLPPCHVLVEDADVVGGFQRLGNDFLAAFADGAHEHPLERAPALLHQEAERDGLGDGFGRRREDGVHSRLL